MRKGNIYICVCVYRCIKKYRYIYIAKISLHCYPITRKKHGQGFPKLVTAYSNLTPQAHIHDRLIVNGRTCLARIEIESEKTSLFVYPYIKLVSKLKLFPLVYLVFHNLFFGQF